MPVYARDENKIILKSSAPSGIHLFLPAAPCTVRLLTFAEKQTSKHTNLSNCYRISLKKLVRNCFCRSNLDIDGLKLF